MKKASIIAASALAVSAFATSAQAHCGHFGQGVWLNDKVATQDADPQKAKLLQDTFYDAFCLASGFEYNKGVLAYNNVKPWTSDDVLRLTDQISFTASFAKVGDGQTRLTVHGQKAAFKLNPFQTEELNSVAVYSILEQVKDKAAKNQKLDGTYVLKR